jgi:hypothetical protein
MRSQQLVNGPLDAGCIVEIYRAGKIDRMIAAQFLQSSWNVRRSAGYLESADSVPTSFNFPKRHYCVCKSGAPSVLSCWEHANT